MSSPNDQAGRVHKQAFMISIAVLFALCLLSAASRFYVRLQIQKQFSIEDAFFLIALCCVICSIVILFSVTIDKLYLVQAFAVNLPNAEIPPDFLQQSYDSHKWIIICLILAWCAIMAVKLCFLSLFRKLIDRIQPLVIYWWVITTYNVVVFAYGVSVYYVICPYFGDPRMFQCNSVFGRARTMRYVVAQTVLDLLGDLLILYIPVKLIWDIQVKWSQKVVLAFSLCLTLFMVLVTITRISGNLMGGLVDLGWELFFVIIAGEIGIILTAMTAFRAFFVSRHKGDNRGVKKLPEIISRSQLHSRSGSFLKLLATPSLWRFKMRAQSASGAGGYAAKDFGGGRHLLPAGNLPGIPRAHMTGVQTFIDRCGRGTTNPSHIMESQARKEGPQEIWPPDKNNHNPVDQV